MQDTKVEDRIAGLDWDLIGQGLDKQGWATIPPLLDTGECDELASLYGQDARFRSTVNMARHNFGEGEYKYFADPLPPLVQSLRECFYPRLAVTANRWASWLNASGDFPGTLDEFLALCQQHGQPKPTPLLLHYRASGFNCLHQDLYGDIAFPLQVVFALSDKDRDYTGGELLLVEQRPRAQSRGSVVTLEKGAGLIFTTRHHPIKGSRGYYRGTMRHGVSPVHSGERMTLGIIFHNAA
ncbi:MAG: 2OG-Fe(II) oxygenase [Dehalococcoidia bacterium]